MTREEEISARFNTLPYATDDTKALESCCGSDGGTGIMDDFGHRIADEVLEPYLQFFIEAPDDIDYLLKQNQRLRGALKAYESECLCRLTETRCERCKGALQALVGDTK